MVKKIRLLGKYNYRSLIILGLSLVLFPLGLSSNIVHTVRIVQGLWTAHNFYFAISSSVVLISFSAYYYFLALKKQQKPLLVSISFSAYTLLFFLISDKSYFMSYVLIVISTLLLFFSFENFHRSIIATLLFLWMNIFLLLNKIFTTTLSNLEINQDSNGEYLIIAGLVLAGGLFMLIYIISNEVHERTELQKQLSKNDMTDKETQILFLHLKDYDKEIICQKLNMDIKTYRVHKGNIKKKLMIYNELTRKNIRSKLFADSDTVQTGRPA